MSTTSIPGASVWEQQLYDHLIQHVRGEMEILQDYDRLAKETDSPAFAYLARLILDDERRHHKILSDLAETIRTSATLSGEPTPIPDLGLFHADREKILAETERFLLAEEEDNRHLKRLAKEMSDVRNTTVWQLIVHLIQQDNEKHRYILRFIATGLVTSVAAQTCVRLGSAMRTRRCRPQSSASASTRARGPRWQPRPVTDR